MKKKKKKKKTPFDLDAAMESVPGEEQQDGNDADEKQDQGDEEVDLVSETEITSFKRLFVSIMLNCV